MGASPVSMCVVWRPASVFTPPRWLPSRASAISAKPCLLPKSLRYCLAALFAWAGIASSYHPAITSLAFMPAAVEVGLLKADHLASYGRDGALLEAIGTERTPVADLVCGSLGQGLSGAIGFALASRLASDDRITYALLSDGEMEEGQVWEAAMFASHHRHRMGQLTVVIDANNSQVDGSVSSVTTIEPLAEKWTSFGWRVADVDGHDIDALSAAFSSRSNDTEPLVVIARTDILGRVRSIPPTVDGHFIKLDDAMRRALTAELEAALV